jgi:hypothetical protein
VTFLDSKEIRQTVRFHRHDQLRVSPVNGAAQPDPFVPGDEQYPIRVGDDVIVADVPDEGASIRQTDLIMRRVALDVWSGATRATHLQRLDDPQRAVQEARPAHRGLTRPA